MVGVTDTQDKRLQICMEFQLLLSKRYYQANIGRSGEKIVKAYKEK